MNTEILFEVFDAWEPLLKARKAKGLDKWDRLKSIGKKLQGKEQTLLLEKSGLSGDSTTQPRHLDVTRLTTVCPI
jgi:hypothetical protein